MQMIQSSLTYGNSFIKFGSFPTNNHVTMIAKSNLFKSNLNTCISTIYVAKQLTLPFLQSYSISTLEYLVGVIKQGNTEAVNNVGPMLGLVSTLSFAM